MSNQNQIDEIFKESFDSFSPEVSNNLWSSISDKISVEPSSGVLGATNFVVWKIIAGAISGLLIGIFAVVIYQNSVSTELELKEEKKNSSSAESLSSKEEKNKNFSEFFTEKTAFDKNDPLIKVSEKDIHQYEIALIDEQSEKEKSTTSHQPGSIVNLFLTPKTRRLNHNNQEQALDEPKINEDTATKVEIVQRDELFPVINASVSGGHSPLVVVFEQSENAEFIKWDFGDGFTESGAVVEHVFRESGTYTVSVQVELNGEIAQATKQISVSPRCIIQSIPNIFTPNGDGENDYFFVKGENIQSFLIQIFDLKGKVVFEADYLGAKWDGNDAVGNPLTVGQYLYFIKAFGKDETDLSTTGSVLLRR